MARRTKAEVEEAVQSLKETLKPGDEVWCVLRSVSRSGMSRVIDLIVPRELTYTNAAGEKVVKPYPKPLSRWAGIACGYVYDEKREGLKVGGCGMDMGFAVVYNLAEALFGDGYALTHRWV